MKSKYASCLKAAPNSLDILKAVYFKLTYRRGFFMNKTELINSLSEETTFSKKDVTRLLDALTRIVERTLKRGDKLQWSGFGTFNVSRRPERIGINPATKERIKLPATVVARFKPGKNLKLLVRSSAR